MRRAERAGIFGDRVIRIENARSHNLRGVSCRVPLNALTVLSGVSGSGKSTLAFDILYAEGQRRYVSSLSTYARQFLERLPRPEVDSISHLPPAIAIERRNRVSSARETVGSASEIQDLLTLLFARAGVIACPDCRLPAQEGSARSIAAQIAERFHSVRIALGVPLAPAEEGAVAPSREQWLAAGYFRVIDPAGEFVELAGLDDAAWTSLQRNGLLLIDRLALGAGGNETPERLVEAVGSAFARSTELCVVSLTDGRRSTYRAGLACTRCGLRLVRPEPARLSFRSPLGACEACHGFGRTAAIDPERVVPDPTLSLAAGAIAPFQTPRGRRWQIALLKACRALGVPVDCPWSEIDPAQRAWVFEGGAQWRGIQRYFERLERKRYRVGARMLLARYRGFATCATCEGSRLRPEARALRLGGHDIAEVARLPFEEFAHWIDALELDPAQRIRSERLLQEIRARTATALQVGLGYMPLDRALRTLSGGEAQRIQLAAALGGTLTSSLYVLDEPSVGLHARDARRLVDVLRGIRDRGNTVVVVEHEPEVLAAADHLIELGPGGGSQGGRLIAEGSAAELSANAVSLAGRVLRGEFQQVARRHHTPRGSLWVRGADAHNLQGIDVEFPLGCLVVVSGVSGAGKSTLVRSVLVGHLLAQPERGSCRAIEGADALGEVVWLDALPPARSSRSNPATLCGAFDGLRARLAQTREARLRGFGPGAFSFNVKGGRCEACEGAGEVVVDMQFLEDLRIPCEVCQGKRYRREVLEVEFDGMNIHQWLSTTVDEALERLRPDPQIARRLRPLAEVGLGYLTLGQPLATLSGGEAQRLRLAQVLIAERPKGLYVLDEPTLGLHPADVSLLLRSFDRVLDAGGSLIVVEHDLQVIRSADHLIELGPDAGPAGGRIVAQGSPEQIERSAATHTGAALRAARRALG